MNFDWQMIAAISIVAVSAAYVVRVGWLSLVKKEAAGCGSSCQSCPSSKSNEPDGFVPLSSLQLTPGDGKDLD